LVYKADIIALVVELLPGYY